MCAVLYKNYPLILTGNAFPDVRGTYTWRGSTTYNGDPYDYWGNDNTHFYVWRSQNYHTYVIADTLPDEPGTGNYWWAADKEPPICAYYPMGLGTKIMYSVLSQNMQTPWEQFGMDNDWLVRSGAFKTMHGQAFFPRTVRPPAYIDATWDPIPRPHYNVPIPDRLFCCWIPTEKQIVYREFYDDPDWWSLTFNISIFQINPQSAEKTYERKHTRIIGSWEAYPGEQRNPIVPCAVHWLPAPGHQVRYFVRAYDHLSFRHEGPDYTTVCPGTVIVSGNPNPDCTGIYYYLDEYNGEHCYKHKDYTWYVYYSLEEPWWMLGNKFEPGPDGWWQHWDAMEGTYTPNHPCTGNPTVTYIPGQEP